MSESVQHDTDLDLSTTQGPPVLGGADPRSRHRGMVIGIVLALLVLGAGLAVPYVVPSRYYMGLLLDGVILAILASSLGFLAKHLGLISLGHTAFYGGAAYATGIAIVRWEFSLLLAVLFAIVVGTLLSLVMGVLVVRASGMGFLMLTLALGQALYQLCIQRAALPWTGAFDGLQISYPRSERFLGLNRTQLMNAAYFWPIAWSALVLTILALWLIGRSRFGIVLEGIRENEERMRFSGYGTYLPRLVAFVISGFAASLAGALFALNASYVSPESLSFLKAGDSLIASIIGGLGVLLGPVFGAFLYVYAQARFNVSGNLHLYTGLALVLVLCFLPGGILGSLVDAIRKRTRRRASPPAPPETEVPS